MKIPTNIAKQWHPDKNGTLKPENFTHGSNNKVWWLCPNKCPEGCLHEWEASISHRCQKTGKGGCPFCSNPLHKWCEHLSFAKTHPIVAKQWHPTKNGDLKPEHFLSGSGRKVWWFCPNKCPKGCSHEWETSIGHRCHEKNTGCPFCSSPVQQCCVHSSIATKRPMVAKQWHPDKNGTLKPEHFTHGSNKKAWWLCPNKCPEGCLHEWEARIIKRCRKNGTGCPFCSDPPRQWCEHVSLTKTHPQIAKQWHPSKNGDLKPENLTHGCNRTVWWLCPNKCPEGCLHEWEACINNRCQETGNGCPFCSYPLHKWCEHVSFVKTHPHLVEQWHPSKNINLRPENFLPASNQKVWWLCPNKHSDKFVHEWEAAVSNRCKENNTDCPFCHRKYSKVQIQYLNYLAIRYPTVQHAKNGGEYQLPNTRYTVDGFISEKNIIVEFHGCIWHGCPTCYKNRQGINPIAKTTYQSLYDKTMAKKKYAVECGYTYIEMWECRWRQGINAVKTIQRLFRQKYRCH